MTFTSCATGSLHHEPIWYRPNLLQEHADILQTIEWINPTLHKAIHAVDTFLTIMPDSRMSRQP